MDCKEFREVLDLYVDGELSPDAITSTRVHANECRSCRSATDELLRLRQVLKDAVNKYEPPPEMIRSVLRATSYRRSLKVAALVTVALLVASILALERMSGLRAHLASGMEQIAFELDQPRTIVLEGEIVCRECELYALYGSPQERDVGGHHGALKTVDGKIWNFMETEKTYALIHDESLIRKRVRVRAKPYRRAGCLEVESYRVLETS